MDNRQDFMKTKPVFSLLLSMAAPMMLSMLIQSLYNIVDSIFVSRLGTGALTAVSIVYPLQNIVLSLSVGTGIGINSVIARKRGEGNQQEADQAASLGMGLTLFHCLLIIIIGLLVSKPFLGMFTKDPQILSWSCQYSYIVLCFSAGSLLQISFEKIFQSVGKMVDTMIALIAGCVTNIILDPIFIFGFLGVPAMGVAGAAIATVIGQSVSLLVYLIIYSHKEIGVKISLRNLKYNKKIIRQIYDVGIPSFLMLAVPSAMTGILNGMLAAFSEIHVAVLGIYLKLQTFLYMPASGVVQAMRPIVGYNYGAGEKERMFRTVRYSMMLVAGMMFLGTVASLGFPAQIFAIFKADTELLESGVSAIRIISLGFIISTVSVVYSGMFEALGRGRDSLIINLLRQFIIIVGLGSVLSRAIGVNGIWICFPIAEIAAAATARWLYNKNK